MRVLITRPREDAEETAHLLEARGVKVATESMLAVVPMAAPSVSIDDVQAFLFTSANGVRAMAAILPEREIPVYTVGDASARAARIAGYKHVFSAGGDVDTLAALVKTELDPEDGALLHAAASIVAGDLKGQLESAGFTVNKVQMYETRPAVALTKVLIDAFRTASIDAAFFFSPRTAKTFVSLSRKAGVEQEFSSVMAYALSPAVAEELSALNWRAVRVAEKPEQDSLLAVFDEDRAAGHVKAGQAAQLAKEIKAERSEAKEIKGGGKPMSSGDKTSNNTGGVTGETVESTDVVAATPETEAAGAGGATVDRDLDIDTTPADDAPDMPSDEPTAAKKSGGSGALVGVLLLAVAGLGGYASMPYWQDKVPEAYRGFLPEFPKSQTQAQLSALAAQVDANKAQVAKLKAELKYVNAELEKARSETITGMVSDTIESLQGKVEDISKRLLTMNDAPAKPGKAPPQDISDAIRHRIDLLTGKVDKQAAVVETFIAEMSETGATLEEGFGKVNARLENVELTRADASSVLKLSDRINDVEQLAKAMVSRHDASLANLLAVVQLRAKAADGMPFDAELRTARALAGDKAEFDALAGSFMKVAGKGVSTTAALRTAYDVLSATAAKAAAAPQGDSLIDKSIGRVMSLVTVRRMDGKDDGPSVNAMLARAESFLNAGDIGGAIKELKAIEAPAVAATLKPWIKRAEARVALDAALSTLTSDALARVAASAMQNDVSAQKKGA